MDELAYLDFDSVVELNEEFTGGGVIDPGGIEAVLARPLSGFGDTEAFPSPWLKAAAVLHGFATTQYFVDGNKRTAFLSATTFLEANGYRLAVFEPVQAEAFVLAVALGAMEVPRIAEWLEVAHKQRVRGVDRDRRMEFVMLSRGASVADNDGTASAVSLGIAGVLIQGAALPFLLQLTVITRIHWDEADMGKDHVVVADVFEDPKPEGGAPRGGGGSTLFPPARGGFGYQPGGRMPNLVAMDIMCGFETGGPHQIEVSIDGEHAATLPFTVTLQ